MVHQQQQDYLNDMKLIFFLRLRSAILLPDQIPTYRPTKAVCRFLLSFACCPPQS